MNHKAFEKSMRAVLVALLLAAAVGPLFGQNATYNLRVGKIDWTMPDGVRVTLWGYGLVSYDLGNGQTGTGDGTPAIPGPRLTVPAGVQGLVVYLENALPELPGEALPPAVSILIPGQALPLAEAPAVTGPVRNTDGRVVSFVHETAPGATQAYIWPSISPGTYLYHSGTHPAVQVQMGLYGALTKNAVEADATVDPVVRAQAYPGAANEYDKDILLIYSEIDPALHLAVAGDPTAVPPVLPTYGTPTYPSTINYHPKYFLVNGEVADAAFDETNAPVNDAAALTTTGSATLLRFVNASLWDHVPQVLGAHVTVLAEYGKPYPYPRQHYSLLLPAGKTLDAVLTPAADGDYPIFDRRLFRSNVPSVLGSMYALIRAEPAPVVPVATP
jgi:FtsP/CotA-like multicopper oxidase with cupredoxin domain